MQWWHYVLIGVVVLGLGALKFFAWQRIKTNRAGKQERENRRPDED